MVQNHRKVIVASGWWCDSRPHDWSLGSPFTRTVEFFPLWYAQVVDCLRPDRVVVTDSASPIKPNITALPIEWITLDRNYGHSNDLRTGRIQTKYSGFTRAVMNGAMYALCCDADFYVFVEQDCLLYGSDFLQHALGNTSSDILLGAPTENGQGLYGRVAAPMLQQSLIVVRRSGLERFIQGVLGSEHGDGERSPEETMRLRLMPFEYLQVPFGRSRPLDFGRTHFYAQHLNDDELRRFCELVRGNSPLLDALRDRATDVPGHQPVSVRDHLLAVGYCVPSKSVLPVSPPETSSKVSNRDEFL
jgi:hypothetical protein